MNGKNEKFKISQLPAGSKNGSGGSDQLQPVVRLPTDKLPELQQVKHSPYLNELRWKSMNHMLDVVRFLENNLLLILMQFLANNRR